MSTESNENIEDLKEFAKFPEELKDKKLIIYFLHLLKKASDIK